MVAAYISQTLGPEPKIEIEEYQEKVFNLLIEFQ